MPNLAKTIEKLKLVKPAIESACRIGLYRATKAARMEAGKTAAPKVNNTPTTSRTGKTITKKTFLARKLNKDFQFKNKSISQMKATIAAETSKDKPIRASHFFVKKQGRLVSASLDGTRSVTGGFLLQRRNGGTPTGGKQLRDRRFKARKWAKASSPKGDDVALVKRDSTARLPLQQIPGTSVRNLVNASAMKAKAESKLATETDAAMKHFIKKVIR